MLESTSTSNQKAGANEQRVVVSGGSVLLNGIMSRPVGAAVMIVFPYVGIASNEHITDALEPLARVCQQAGMGTLLVNLLTPEDEELDRLTGFFHENTSVLHQRVMGIANWLIERAEPGGMSMGYVGAGVGGAAILAAADARPDAINAIVAIAPRIDLVRSHLPGVVAPTLLIAGEQDTTAVETGRQAMGELMSDTRLHSVLRAKELGITNRLEIMRGIANVLEDEQALQTVGQQAIDWFKKYLF